MKKINCVLDTNTLISAFLLSQTSLVAQAYYKAISNNVIVFSDDTFNEFSDVFIRPKFDRYVPLNRRLNIIEDIRVMVKFIPVTNTIHICRDPKDDKYLELAIEADVAYIITGDKDLLILNPFNNIPILTAAEFLKTF